MKRKIISTILVLVMVLSLFPMSAMAATKPTDADWKTPPIISDLKIDHDEYHVWLEAEIKTPANVLNAIEYSQEGDNWEEVGYITTIEMKVTIDGKEYEDYLDMNYSEKNPEVSNGDFCGIYETVGLAELHVDSEVRAQVRYCGWYFPDSISDSRFSDWSNELVLNEKADFTASQWALAELAEADKLGLIPDSLRNADLTKPITRAEFATVSVRVYEALSGEKASPVEVNPFTDTKDVEVLKAYNLGITTGVSATTFEPNTLLNREQAATMLTRTFKRATMNGWTIQNDAQFTLTYDKPSAFADDKDISDWAKDSVYFMAANGIINGVGNNKFAPKNVTSADEANGYANATREQALIIAVRMVENLK